jgi:hypothetical protein
MTQPRPAWKFWHPLPLWHVLVIFFVAQFAAGIFLVLLREGLGLTWLPAAASGGVGAFLGYVVTVGRARRALGGAP